MGILEYPLGFFKTLYGPSQPLWVQIWVSWLMIINTASIAFYKEKVGKVTFWVWMGNAPTMMLFFALFGYTKILGMPHVIWWTPLVIFLFKQKDKLPATKFLKPWFWTVLITNTLSLVIDYIDVFRYFLKK